MNTVTVALWVKLDAKPGKEGDLDTFLRSALPLVQEEPATVTWFAIRLGPWTFGIFDAFPIAYEALLAQRLGIQGLSVF
jgi:hypothetical protein